MEEAFSKWVGTSRSRVQGRNQLFISGYFHGISFDDVIVVIEP